MAKTKISQFDATAANNTDLNSISIAEGTAPSNINNAIRELMSQLADLNLGNEVLSTLKIDNLHLDGNTIVTLDTNGDLNLTPNGTGSVVVAKVDINGGAIDGTPIGAASANTGAFTTLSASSTANLGSSVTVSGGNIDGVIGANTPAAITGTVITANTNFAGNLTGNVTGTVDGVVGGTTPAAVTGTTITANTKFVGPIDGNVTATSGTSTFNNVTINGTLDMDSTTSQTITGLATPSGSTDAATKGYVDTEVSGLVDSAPSTLNTLNELAAALGDDASFSTTVTNSIAAKLPLAGGTMTGDINANSNTVSGLKAPSASNDATTKTYVDTADALKLNLSGGTLSGNIAMGDNKVTGLAAPTDDNDAARKKYVDDIAGSGTAAATSASQAATSATNAANSATASANSATAASSSAASAAASYDSFDDRYLGAKSSAPTVDNDGDALVTGALYFNTTSNQLFVRNSSSAWVQAAFTSSGFLSNLSEDTSPQLGGDLDINGQNIVSTSNADIDILPNGSGKINLDGNGSSGGVTVSDGLIDIRTGTGAVSKINFYCESSNAHAQTIQAQPHSAGVTNALTLPAGGDQEIVGASATQTLTNKTIDASQLSGSVANARLDADLQALAGLTSAADKGIQFTGSGTAGTYDLTSAGKALLDDADAAAQRTTLGLGSAATLTAGTSASNAVQLDGSAKLPAVDGSQLTGLASGGTVDMVADGNIAIRKPVILTAAGKAKEVTQTTSLADSVSTNFAQALTNTTGDTVSSVYDSNSETFCMAFKDTSNSNYGTVVCGTPSNGTVTWGTPVVFESSAIDDQPKLAAGGNRIHVTYYDTSNNNAGIRSASISGTTPTFAAETVFATGSTYNDTKAMHIAYDTSTNYVIALYQGGTGTIKTWVQAIYHDTSDGTYTAGSATELYTGSLTNAASGIVFDPDTNRTIIAYKDGSNSSYPTANVVQSSGTAGSPTVTIGADTLLNGSSAADDMDIVYDTTNNKAVIFFDDAGGGNLVKAVIGTVTGGGTNTIAVTSPTTIWDPTGNPNYWAAGYDGDKNRIQYFYHDEDSGDDFTYKVITPSASSLSVADGGVISANQNKMGSGSASFGAGHGVLCATLDSGNSSRISYGMVYFASTTSSNLDNGNYLGIAAEAISDTATGKIAVDGGLSEGHSSLTIGSYYFATDAGAIATSGTQLIGKALTATEIQLGVKSGTVAHNTVALDLNAKLPAVDGSQLTNLPAPSDARVFCGAVDFKRDTGVGTSVILSKPDSLTASEIRAYEIHFYGVGTTNDAGYNIRFKPYKSGSSVMSGNNFRGAATGNYNGTSYQTASDNFSSYLSFRMYGASYPYRNPADEIQDYDGNGYSGKLTAKVVYENNFKNAAFSYQASVRTGASDYYMNNEMGSFSAAGSETTTDYAEQFYFYVNSGTYEEGVIVLYAIKK